MTELNPPRKWDSGLFYCGVWDPSLSSGVFSETDLDHYSHLRLWTDAGCLRRMINIINNDQIPRLRAQELDITDFNPHTQSRSSSLSSTIGWTDGRRALCATYLPRGYTGKDPCAIQSSSNNTRERASNSAQSCPPLFTPLGYWEA